MTTAEMTCSGLFTFSFNDLLSRPTMSIAEVRFPGRLSISHIILRATRSTRIPSPAFPLFRVPNVLSIELVLCLKAATIDAPRLKGHDSFEVVVILFVGKLDGAFSPALFFRPVNSSLISCGLCGRPANRLFCA